MLFDIPSSCCFLFFCTHCPSNTHTSQQQHTLVRTSSLFLEPRKCLATCSGSMLVTSASFQRLISNTLSFWLCTPIFHRKSFLD